MSEFSVCGRDALKMFMCLNTGSIVATTVLRDCETLGDGA